MLFIRDVRMLCGLAGTMFLFSSILDGCVSNLYRIDARTIGFKSFDAGDTTTYEAAKGFYYVEASDAQDGKKVVLFHKYGGDSTQLTHNPVKVGNKYNIEPKQLVEDQNVSFKQGFNIVGLVVPFKYRLGSDASLSPSSTIGPSAAYTYSVGMNTQVTWSGFAGVCAIPLNDINSDKVNNRFGLSYGVAFVLGVNKSLQLGAVYGWDNLVDNSINWQYNNRPWVAFGIGYKFLNF
jgi:hypothetical protein